MAPQAVHFGQGTPAHQASTLGHHLGPWPWKPVWRHFHMMRVKNVHLSEHKPMDTKWYKYRQYWWILIGELFIQYSPINIADVHGNPPYGPIAAMTPFHISFARCDLSLGPAQPPNMPRPTPRAPSSWSTVFWGGANRNTSFSWYTISWTITFLLRYYKKGYIYVYFYYQKIYSENRKLHIGSIYISTILMSIYIWCQ